MITIFLIILSVLSLLIGMAPIYMTLLEVFPISWLYYHLRLSKMLNWFILLSVILLMAIHISLNNTFSLWSIVPFLLSVIGLLMTYRLRQQNIFPAVDYPSIASNYMTLPLKDDMEIAVIEYDGVTKCYPLDYVIHKHIINDRFNDKIISLTYCAMCRSIIPFNVTNIGPLFVASFKHANMIVADKKTKTFFNKPILTL